MFRSSDGTFYVGFFFSIAPTVRISRAGLRFDESFLVEPVVINFRYAEVIESLLNVSGRYFAIMLMSHRAMCVSSGFSTGQN
jgi:hypothetical protein